MRRARTQAAALRLIWLPGDVLDKLSRLRGAAESYSDVILRLAAEASDSGR
jgi:predicted CopG family antitoxin